MTSSHFSLGYLTWEVELLELKLYVMMGEYYISAKAEAPSKEGQIRFSLGSLMF